MRLNQFHRRLADVQGKSKVLLSLQGKSPLAVSHGYAPPPTDWTDVIVTASATAFLLFLMVMA